MLISRCKLLQQQTDSVHVSILDSILDLERNREDIQSHRNQCVISEYPRQLDDSGLSKRLHSLRIKTVVDTASLVQRLAHSINQQFIISGESRRCLLTQRFDDLIRYTRRTRDRFMNLPLGLWLPTMKP